jgi:alkylhydroperoxidase family enzyme
MARVPYQSPADLPEEYSEYVVSSLQPGKEINVYASIGNNPEVLAGLRSFLGTLWNDSGLTDRQRELVILATAAETGNAYEWHQHVNVATNVGLTPAEVTAVADDDPEPFDATERALMEYARAVVRGEVTDDLHATMAERFDDRAVVGAAATAAGYMGLGRIIEALDVGVETGDEFVGWDVAE